MQDGFRAVKAAPFDGFPAAGSPAAVIDAAVESGIASVAAMREAIGPDVELMVDCHSFFDVPLAERVARRLEPQQLAWYEEPVAPERIEETREIRRRIKQPMAAGEILYGVAGFAPLSRDRTVHVIMPDVKHCGGLLELTRIAAAAENDGVTVAPHNPSGPVSTAASIQVCAVLKNFRLLEFQWGEVAWRHDLLNPPERFENGAIRVPERPGLGVDLNEEDPPRPFDVSAAPRHEAVNRALRPTTAEDKTKKRQNRRTPESDYVTSLSYREGILVAFDQVQRVTRS